MEFRATESALPEAAAAATRTNASGIRNALVATLKALDRRFLSDDSIPPEERLTSGCTGVLLHITLGEAPVATAASLGPSSAVVGQRRGGLASATSEPLVLCGGEATSHNALQDFLASLAAEQRQLASSLLPKKAANGKPAASQKASARKLKSSSGSSTGGMSQRRLVGPAAGEAGGGLQPAYSSDPAAPQALGFGCAKGLRLVPAGRGVPVDEPPSAVMGLEVKTASHALGPADDCVVLLSGGAAAGITPRDVALLMHRMGRLAAIPYETKPRPLPMDAARGPSAVQLDNLGPAGLRPAAPPPPTTPIAIEPFNAARLLVQHAASNAASRHPNNASGGNQHPAGAMAFALEWLRCSDDSAGAAAASGASVSAVRAAAEAAASARRRAQYRWQLLRLYYKFPYKRHVAIIDRWHSVFDRVMGQAKQLAKQKERSAWTRLNAAVKVTPGGNVQCLAARDAAAPEQHDADARAPATPGGGARQSRTAAGGMPPVSPLRGNSATRQQHYRSRLSAADASTANPYSSPGGAVAAVTPVAAGSGGIPRSPMSAEGSSGTRQRTTIAAINSSRQRSPSLASSATPRCASAREARSPPSPAAGSMEGSAAQAAAALVAARRASLPVSPPQYRPVGLLEAEGIELRDGSVQRLRSGAATSDGGRERAPSASPSFADMPSQRPSVAPAAGPSPIVVVPSSPSSAADDARANDHGSDPGGKGRADGAAGPGDDAAAGHCDPCASVGPAIDPPVAATAVMDAVTAPLLAPERAPSVRSASPSANGGAAREGAAQSITARPAAAVAATSPGSSSVSAAIKTTSPRIPASPRAAAASTRIPSLSAGGAPVSSSPARSGSTDAAAASPLTSRARAASQATPRSSIPSAIPTLQLQPAASAVAAAHSTPRLSMPGGIPTFQRTPPSASAGGAAGASHTPPTRASNTWGGAPGASDTPNTATNAAPNSARSGSSRLPRPTNLSATMPARSGGGAAPAASPAGSAISGRSLFASGGGGDASSAIKTTTARPPRLDVSSSVVVSLAAAATPGGGGDEADLFSPDAAQLEAWAAEAVNVINVSATKKQPTPQTPPPQQLAATSSGQRQQGQDPGTSGGRGMVTTPSGSWKSASLGRTGGSGTSGGGAKPGLGSRIPLSPRHPNANSGNSNNSNPLSRTPSHGSASKPTRALSPSASLSAGVAPAVSGDFSASTPQRSGSARSRR
ncbi:hypothetical protein PLESTB_000671500 [Pleodorina starrii]|uniref:Uncharacterized protein n=1 Tax=Pleodorina starrii TaxID=330485 RepID=A0A9W6F1I1_9CHLO|nr:hypothetical protein PLESTB_000671500 [Pleodorina starrii]